MAKVNKKTKASAPKTVKKGAAPRLVAPKSGADMAKNSALTGQYIVDQINILQTAYSDLMQGIQALKIDTERKVEQMMADANAKHGAIQAFNIMLAKHAEKSATPPAIVAEAKTKTKKAK